MSDRKQSYFRYRRLRAAATKAATTQTRARRTDAIDTIDELAAAAAQNLLNRSPDLEESSSATITRPRNTIFGERFMEDETPTKMWSVVEFEAGSVFLTEHSDLTITLRDGKTVPFVPLDHVTEGHEIDALQKQLTGMTARTEPTVILPTATESPATPEADDEEATENPLVALKRRINASA